MGRKRIEYQINTIDDAAGGINTDSVKTAPNEMRRLENFNVTKRGSLEVRGGSLTKNLTHSIPTTAGKGILHLNALITRDLATGVKTRHLLGVAKTNLFSLQTSGDTLDITGYTNIYTSLTTDLYPSTINFQNKMFLVNGKEQIWTDGTNAYEIGIEKPTVAPTLNSAPTTGGLMSDGTYYFYYAYARSTSYGFYGEVGDSVKVVLSGGTSTQKVLIDTKASNNPDTSADKIYLFRTKAGDPTNYYKVGEAANPNDGSTVTITATIDDDGIAGSSLYEQDHTPPPSSVKYIAGGFNRAYYADDRYIYYSLPNLPECVPATNIIKPKEDDGESIVGLGVILNYLVAPKITRTAIWEMADIGSQDPLIISNELGGTGFRTITPIMNGQLTAWLSSSGLVATDGVDVKNITVNKVFYDMQDMDLNNIDKAFSVYYSKKRQLLVYIPYLGGTSKLWVFHTDTGAYSNHVYHKSPTCFAIFPDENGQDTLVWAYTDTAGTAGFIATGDDGVQDDGSDIHYLLQTPYIDLGRPDIEKDVRSAQISWTTDSPSTATVTLGLNGVDNRDEDDISSNGSAVFDVALFDVDKFDMSGEEMDIAEFKHTRGSSFNHSIYGYADNHITFKSITTSMNIVTKKGYND